MISRSDSTSNISRSDRAFDYPARSKLDDLCNVSRRSNSSSSDSLPSYDSRYGGSGHFFEPVSDKIKRERLGSFTSITSATSTLNYPDNDVIQQDSCSIGNQRPAEVKEERTSIVIKKRPIRNRPRQNRYPRRPKTFGNRNKHHTKQKSDVDKKASPSPPRHTSTRKSSSPTISSRSDTRRSGSPSVLPRCSRIDRKFILSGHRKINDLLQNNDSNRSAQNAHDVTKQESDGSSSSSHSTRRPRTPSTSSRFRHGMGDSLDMYVNVDDLDSRSMASSVTDMAVIFDRSIPRDIETQNKLPVITKEYTEKEKEELMTILKTTNWRKLRFRRPVWKWSDLDPGSMVYFKYGWVWQAGLLTGKYENTKEMEVIHYAKGPTIFHSRIVKEEKLTVNLDNNELMQVNIPPALQRRPEETVARARELLGEQRYSMFTRRSSHMVLECLLKQDL